MLKKITFFIFILISAYGFSQNLTDDQGHKQGKWSKKHKNGKLRYEGQFSDNKEIGEFKFYDKYGKLVSTRTYKTPGGKADCEMYNMYGYLHAKGSMNGRNKEGEWIFYVNKGLDTVTVEHYNNGVLHGEHTTFFSNGHIASQVNYDNGVKIGSFTEYYKNGQIEQKGTYAKGEIDGTIEFWYNNGQLKRKGAYLKGIKIGKWITYLPDGKVKEVIDHNKK